MAEEVYDGAIGIDLGELITVLCAEKCIDIIDRNNIFLRCQL